MKNIFLLLLLGVILTSCAEQKTFYIKNNKEVSKQDYLTSEVNSKDSFYNIEAKPYGWANSDVRKRKNVLYEANLGNIFLSIIFCETIIVPIYLTGWEFYEPVRLDDDAKL